MSIKNKTTLKNILLYTIVTGTSLSFHLFAQFPGPEGPALKFSVDSAQFRINDSLYLGELYFAVPRQTLNFIPEGQGLRARYEISVTVLRQGREITQQRWTATSFAAGPEEIKSTQSLFNVARFQFKPGVYVIRTKISDLNGETRGEKEVPLKIRALPIDKLTLSDIEMATEIERDTSRTVFQRNGYRVIPNPGRLYGDGLVVLRFYFEIYNLQPADAATYSVRYRIFDAGGQTTKMFAKKNKRIAAKNLVEIGGINIVTLRTGVYTLQVSVRDNGSGQQAIREQVFYIFRKKDKRDRQDVTSPAVTKNLLLRLYESYDEQKLDEEFEAAVWIASATEKSIYKSLDLGGKKRFMGQFWYSRDPDSSTVRNEFRENYLARAAYARQNFGGLKKGVKSDRGRVLLIYGAPSEIERYPSEQGLRAYQIWQYYETEGGIEFMFVDTHDWGDYSLVHSTARDELHDEDWQRWLSIQPR